MKRKIIFVTLCILSALLCLSPGLGICSASPAVQEQQVSMSKQDLTTLIENNKKQRIALEQSKAALQTASDALTQSQTALSEAREQLQQSQTTTAELRTESENLKNQLTESQAALTKSQQQTAQLLTELQQQKQQTNELQLHWGTLRSYADNAQNSIDKAEKSLQDTRQAFNESEKAHAKTEKSLKNRITAWQIVAAIVGGIAISK